MPGIVRRLKISGALLQRATYGGGIPCTAAARKPRAKTHTHTPMASIRVRVERTETSADGTCVSSVAMFSVPLLARKLLQTALKVGNRCTLLHACPHLCSRRLTAAAAIHVNCCVQKTRCAQENIEQPPKSCAQCMHAHTLWLQSSCSGSAVRVHTHLTVCWQLARLGTSVCVCHSVRVPSCAIPFLVGKACFSW